MRYFGIKQFLTIVLIYFLNISVVYPRNLDVIKSSGILLAGMTADAVNFSVNNGIYSGFNYEIAAKFAESLGVKLKIVEIDEFGKFFSSDTAGAISDTTKTNPDISYTPYLFATGAIDIAADVITINDWRQRLVNMSQILKNKQLIYTINKEKTVKSAAELAGVRFIVLKNSTYEDTLKNEILPIAQKMDIGYTTATDRESIDALLRGDYQYGIIDAISFFMFKKDFPDLKVCFPASPVEDLGWAFAKADTELSAAFDKFIKTFKLSKGYDNLFVKYFGVAETNYMFILGK